MKLIKGQEVLYKHFKGSKEAVVFIHGILEGPKQFSKLAEIAYRKGYSVYMIFLPGHGGSSMEFATTNYMRWIEFVSKHISLLLSRYKSILIVGHSMGALLAICEKVARPKGIKALFLIDPPLKVHLWPRVIKGAIKIYLGQVKPKERYILAEYHAMSVGPLKPKAFIGWVTRYSELLSIVAYTKKQISKVHLPIYLVFAAKDEFVSWKSRAYFKSYSGELKVLYLKNSGHFFYDCKDLIRLEKAYTNFIGEQKIKHSLE